MAGDSAGNVWMFLNTGSRTEPKLAKGEKVEADGKPIMASQKTYKQVGGSYIIDKVIPGSSELADIYSKIHVADWDGDGLKDLLVGHESTIIFYRNAGTASQPRFLAPRRIEPPQGDSWPARPSPYMIDWDGDGKKDLLLGSESPKIMFYRNTGGGKIPQLERGVDLNLKGEGFEQSYRCRIDVTDWNNDGKLDLLVGTFYSNKQPDGGNVWLFLGQ